MIVIYHNNRCSKSRLCLDLIKKSGTDYEVIEYLKENLSVNNIKEIVYGLEGEINEILSKLESQEGNLEDYQSDYFRLVQLNKYVDELFKKKFKEISQNKIND